VRDRGGTRGAGRGVFGRDKANVTRRVMSQGERRDDVTKRGIDVTGKG